MKLVLYSGGSLAANRALHGEFIRLLGAKENPRVTFIPVDPEDAEAEYAELKKSFQQFGIEHVEYFLLDHSYTKKDLDRVFASDAIYLGGGNTFQFLHQVRESGLLTKLRRYAKSGGILMGLSAGAILLTPSITTASVPSLDCDVNAIGIKDLRALSLVPFEFSPHYEAKRKSDAELKEHSRKVNHPVYACKNGAGIVVEGEKISFVGPVEVFYQGEKYSLH